MEQINHWQGKKLVKPNGGFKPSCDGVGLIPLWRHNFSSSLTSSRRLGILRPKQEVRRAGVISLLVNYTPFVSLHTLHSICGTHNTYSEVEDAVASDIASH